MLYGVIRTKDYESFLNRFHPRSEENMPGISHGNDSPCSSSSDSTGHITFYLNSCCHHMTGDVESCGNTIPQEE